jgi:hypothetical protein
MSCTAMLSNIALIGTSSLVLTCFHHLEPGMAPSRAKAHVQRDAAVVQPIPQKSAKTRSGKSKPIAPPEEPTALLIITGTGWPEARSASIVWSGRTKTSGMRKKRPAMVLSTMVPTIALGTCLAGSWTSSHILQCVSIVIFIRGETRAVGGRFGTHMLHGRTPFIQIRSNQPETSLYLKSTPKIFYLIGLGDSPVRLFVGCGEGVCGRMGTMCTRRMGRQAV